MKIRLIGSEDLVTAWAAELQRAYGVKVALYPSRGGPEVRAYCDLDDRAAAEIVGQAHGGKPAAPRDQPVGHPNPGTVAGTRRRRLR
jgi:hypothetical protein